MLKYFALFIMVGALWGCASPTSNSSSTQSATTAYSPFVGSWLNTSTVSNGDIQKATFVFTTTTFVDNTVVTGTNNPGSVSVPFTLVQTLSSSSSSLDGVFQVGTITGTLYTGLTTGSYYRMSFTVSGNTLINKSSSSATTSTAAASSSWTGSDMVLTKQ